MLYVRNDSNNAYFNIALEEFILKKSLKTGETYVILYINDPAIIIGKHQNTMEEVNREYVKENNIYVVRRMSGGGAVYHDEGNLNFSYILKAGKEEVNNFQKFTQPVIKALDKMGIQAKLSGRNDLTIDGKKFSGNAQYYQKNRLLHHGTLLFNSQMSNLANSLNVKAEKIQSKGIKSVRSRVTNIIDYLEEKRSIEEFKELLIKYLFEDEEVQEYHLTEEDLAAVEQLVKEKYSTWQWNWGESPAFDLERSKRFPIGLIDVRLNVKEGYITHCKIFGDFFGSGNVEDIENILTGTKYKEEDITEALKKIPIEQYFGKITLEEFLTCIL
ncbi:lipoate--protein ligase [Irregularibacter muris]|uniref:lipoate--protein ligase n=1 Tax=Irregularibacter muris TaxID=1796619 RepID=A0AAE3L0P8_9FIRM|nr:lipoate--protein ligase [Irregularibacter muris]MCR1900287.1 lipoate--protein ligase [Irregularibacter muris]